MTRINIGVPPKLLTDSHLMAEHREIIRVPTIAYKRLKDVGNLKGCPKEFVLGTGHVLFFCPYGEYTYDRYLQLYRECCNRNFLVGNYFEQWDNIRHTPEGRLKAFYNLEFIPADWIKLVVERIKYNLSESNQTPRYYGKDITVQEACEKLDNYISTL